MLDSVIVSIMSELQCNDVVRFFTPGLTPLQTIIYWMSEFYDVTPTQFMRVLLLAIDGRWEL